MLGRKRRSCRGRASCCVVIYLWASGAPLFRATTQLYTDKREIVKISSDDARMPTRPRAPESRRSTSATRTQAQSRDPEDGKQTTGHLLATSEEFMKTHGQKWTSH